MLGIVAFLISDDGKTGQPADASGALSAPKA
jgi:hypothetical protein